MFTISHTYSFESYCLETKMKLQLSCSPDAYSCSCTLWYRGICHILYNCVNCTLAQALADKRDRFQRRMACSGSLRSWMRTCNIDAIHPVITRMSVYSYEHKRHTRWRLFGHTLRMDDISPARKAMTCFVF